MSQNLEEKFKKIKNIVFDVDGVFTDATLVVSDTDVTRTFNVRDGYAVSMAAKAGYTMAVITGGKQRSIKTRLEGLGIKNVFYNVGTAGKLATFDAFIEDNNLTVEETLYIGDDIPDYLLMIDRNVLRACPADAVEEVKAICDYISPLNGGKGVVRDILERIMKAQDTWMKQF